MHWLDGGAEQRPPLILFFFVHVVTLGVRGVISLLAFLLASVVNQTKGKPSPFERWKNISGFLKVTSSIDSFKVFLRFHVCGLLMLCGRPFNGLYGLLARTKLINALVKRELFVGAFFLH